jgi:hypothetical protein
MTYDDCECNYQNISIEEEIVKLAIEILQKEYGLKIIINNTDLLTMYKIACFLESYFFYNKIGSIYLINFSYDNKYFKEFSNLIMQYLVHYNQRINIDVILHILLKIVYGAKSMLILFRPYGYGALSVNQKIIGFNLQAIFEFKSESLRYFALANLIELKLNDKKIHSDIKDINGYVNSIFIGASIIN